MTGSAFNQSQIALRQSYVGKNAVGANADAVVASTGKWIFKKITLANPALLASIDVWAQGSATQVSSLFSMLADDNAGVPGKAISLGNVPGMDNTALHTLLNADFTTTARWVAMPSGIYLPAASYWMGVFFGGLVNGAMNLFYDTGGGDYTNGTNATWVNDAHASGATNSTRDYSIRGSIIS